MCGQSTAKRRRKQAVNEFRHLAKLGRPIYGKSDAAAAARRLSDLIKREKEIRQRKGSSKK